MIEYYILFCAMAAGPERMVPFQADDFVNAKFSQSSSAIDLSSPCIVDWDQFPLNCPNCDRTYLGAVKTQLNRFFAYDAAVFDSSCAKAWKPMLQKTFPGWMLQGPGPEVVDMLMAIVHRSLHNRHLGSSNLDYIEYFSGNGELSKAAIRCGLDGMSFDVVYTPAHDALSRRGLRLFLAALCGTKPGSLNWFGTVCSSFVVLCRAQSLRNLSNGFHGDTNRLFVQIGNGLAAVSALLFLVSAIIGNVPALEQPMNSCMPQMTVMNCVLTFYRSYRIVTYHGAFGGETCKPLQILSPSSKIMSLTRSKPYIDNDDDNSALVTRDDSGAFTGRKHQLCQSQAYTREFGEAVIKTFFGQQQQ